jgi:aryl-alcohol dehydrogenase-like predicted oxidoreductase
MERTLMEYVTLGTSDLLISGIVLGCLSFGEPIRGGHPWTLSEAASRPLIRRAVEHGVNAFDTADGYSDGSSEEILGRALGDFARRDEVVIATKIFENRPGLPSLTRQRIRDSIDGSLARLGTDHVDLFQIHRFDPLVPLEETMEALHDVVRSGKARHIGASSMRAWQFAKAQRVAERGGWTPFVSMQNHYNLLDREDEREMLPLCADEGIGVVPWSPLARGRLALPSGAATERSGVDEFGDALYAGHEDSDRRIIEAVGAVAAARGVSRAAVALAWLRGRPAVAAPIVGVLADTHLDDALASIDLALDDSERAALEAPYTPRQPDDFLQQFDL